MVIGETLLKITDYPFTYSLVFLWLRFSQIDPFSIEASGFLVAAGFGGTVLAILDPFGRFFKLFSMSMDKDLLHYYNDPNLKKKLSFKFLSKLNPKLKIEPKMKRKWEYVQSAYHTKSIEIERDKIVSSFYFILIILASTYLLDTTIIFDKIVPSVLISDSCNAECIRENTIIILLSISFPIAVVTAWKWSQISKNAIVVSIYLQAISTNFVPKASTDTLTRFIEAGDWKTAEYWKNIVEEEYVQEEGLRDAREEKLRNHVEKIVNEFQKYKNDLDEKNMQLLLDSASFNDPSHMKTLEEKFKEFPLYDRLIEHLFTNEPNEIYIMFQKYLELQIVIQQKNEQWEKLNDDEIQEIFKKLDVSKKLIEDKRPHGIRGEGQQWINFNALKKDFGDFLYENRDALIPIKNQKNTPMWQVKFYDSAMGVPRDDIVALLYKSDANTLSNELGILAKKLRKSENFTISVYSDLFQTEKDLDLKIKELFASYFLNSEALKGSCDLCRNEQFFSKKKIEIYEKQLLDFPLKLLEKNNIITRPKRKKSIT